MPEQTHLAELTVDLLSAFVANNSVRTDDLPKLVQSTFAVLKGLEQENALEAIPEPEHVPAVTMKKSLANPEKIISMIDGRPYTTLRRHLSKHGLTPEEYRKRYGLPPSYPMTALAYSERRKELAISFGLGKKKLTPEPASATTSAKASKAARNSRKKAQKAVEPA